MGEHWGLSSFCDFSNLFFHKNRVVCHVHRLSMDSVKNFPRDLCEKASFPNDSMRTLLKMKGKLGRNRGQYEDQIPQR